jgi:transposase-like protein
VDCIVNLKEEYKNEPVFGIFFRNWHVYTEIVLDANKPTLQGIINGKIDPKSIEITQWSRGYDGLVNVGYDKNYWMNDEEN